MFLAVDISWMNAEYPHLAWAHGAVLEWRLQLEYEAAGAGDGSSIVCCAPSPAVLFLTWHLH